ncbi:hypothetical protein K2173_021717 [Erythroxylum novogranatense]|uniref:NHL repeat-containing protein 2 n=1 Tax=Erythroxylum novogranatense TaxID=1862640 RepID=A0AAV8TJL1_9ROSI|nr:hypothetical protein K2173_021717 [Erythroxylum novogranatense]
MRGRRRGIILLDPEMMYTRYQRVRRISTLLPHVFQGSHHLKPYRAIINLSVLCVMPLASSIDNGFRDFKRVIQSQRYSTRMEVSNEYCLKEASGILSFIESTLYEIQGLNHHWFNLPEERIDSLKKGGTFFVLAGQLLENPRMVAMLEKVKSVQQRFPQLNVIGFHSGSSISSAGDQALLLRLIMSEFITFPILWSNMNFSKIENGAFYVLFRDFRNPAIFNENLELEMLNKAVLKLNAQVDGNVDEENPSLRCLKGTWSKQSETITEPNSCSLLQNLFLYFPGCISADENGNRLFLSDSNHHRVIILDGNGKILDCIGSSPGFEDGDFESAKLIRPAASFYSDTEDCLYVVDSENHAIRRVDMERRVLETVYPSSIRKKQKSVWTWIANKLGFGKKSKAEFEEFSSQSLVFPWHLLKSVDNDFLIISRSFETLWIMDLASGEIKEKIEGHSNIMEICGLLIMEKESILTQMPRNWLQVQTDAHCSLKWLSYASLLPSLTTFQDHIVMCDAVAQRVLKLSREAGACSTILFSNFGILGFPYWISFPLERVYYVAGACKTFIDNIQCFTLLPGRIDIRLNIDIPIGTKLVEPLSEECIQRQARGAAIEVQGAEGTVGSSNKVGAAQQWYDELDNLAFETPEPEINVEEEHTTLDVKSQDGRFHIDSAVNTSPGASEVVVYAALYLKLKTHPEYEETREEYAARIADILNPARSGEMERDSCFQLLSQSHGDLRDLIFLRPLHVRVKLETLDHPKADNTKNIVLTNSAVEVNVSL